MDIVNFEYDMTLTEKMEMFGVEHSDYIEALFDDSEYGEAFIGMAIHTSEMSGLDRMISEDGYKGAKVSIPRFLQTDGKIYWQRPEWLAKQIETDALTASKFVAMWMRMDPTEKMVKTFIRWIQKNGVHGALVYFTKLTQELDSVTIEADEFIPLNIVEPEPEPDEDEVNLEDEEVDLVDFNVPSIPFRYIPIGITDDFVLDSELGFTRPEPKQWLEKQPAWFRDEVTKIKSI